LIGFHFTIGKGCTETMHRFGSKGTKEQVYCKCAMPHSYKRIIDKENESVQLNNLL